MSPSLSGKQNATPIIAKRRKMSFYEQLLMYLGLIIGVIASSILTGIDVIEGEGSQVTMDLSRLSLPSILASSVIALIIIPLVYDRLKIDPDSPFIVRFGLFAQNGFFWQALLESMSKFF